MKVQITRSLGRGLIEELKLPKREYLEGQTYDIPDAAAAVLIAQRLAEAAPIAPEHKA